MEKIETSIKSFAAEFEIYLNACLPAADDLPQKTVIKAMRYSLLSGGKRIRPFLLTSFCKSCGGDAKQALPFAAAIEMVHTYSLIHDDLPCMDNDALRRGRPTSHIVFGEAAAVLAGDGLLNFAAETALRKGREAGIPAERILEALELIFTASGAFGMVGGQIVDMEGESRPMSVEELSTMHRLKTGAIIKTAAMAGCVVGGGSKQMTREAGEFAQKLGLAFQIVDDVLDSIGNTEQMGKKVGSDLENNKTTYVSLLGIEGAKAEAQRLTAEAKSALKSFKDAQFYAEMADTLLERGK